MKKISKFVLILLIALVTAIVLAAVFSHNAIAYEISQCTAIGIQFAMGHHTLTQSYGSAAAGTVVDVISSLGYLCGGINHANTDWGLIPGWILKFTDGRG